MSLLLRLLGFNGATAMTPWKRLRCGRAFLPTQGFNGATAMTPWKRVRHRVRQTQPEMLQWGHGDDAVEEFVVVVVGLLFDRASMGPRR